MADAHQKEFGLRSVAGWISEILGPDGAFLRLALVYGVAIALLGLATPISVQLLINSVANLALPAPLFTLSLVLLTLLLLLAGLSALRVHMMALFERRFFARIVADVTLRAIYAQNPFFADERRVALFNRFFDVVVVQKSVPELLIGGFTIVLQSVVGLTITSFYHPFFLAFNIVLVGLLLFIWQVWARGAIRSAIGLSHAKHDAAHWVESVGVSNGFYKSARHTAFAVERSEAMIAGYVRAHKRHFRYTYTQTIAFLSVYALASAALLALGGWLIIQGELSIGQLVAAELILSGVFYGIAQLGSYLEKFYDLAASLEELDQLYSIPQETYEAPTGVGPAHGGLRLMGVEYKDLRFDFEIRSGEQLTIMADPEVDHGLAVILKRHVHPERGLVMVGGADIESFDMFQLRSEIMVFERPNVVEITIRDYFRLAGPESSTQLYDMLRLTGLADRIAQLPLGLDTPLSTTGRPLSPGEMMALKLTMALLTRPKVLVLAPLYDLLPPDRLRAALGFLRGHGTTVLQFTRRPEISCTDGFMWFGRREQLRCPDVDTLLWRAGEGRTSDVLPA